MDDITKTVPGPLGLQLVAQLQTLTAGICTSTKYQNSEVMSLISLKQVMPSKWLRKRVLLSACLCSSEIYAALCWVGDWNCYLPSVDFLALALPKGSSVTEEWLQRLGSRLHWWESLVKWPCPVCVMSLWKVIFRLQTGSKEP